MPESLSFAAAQVGLRFPLQQLYQNEDLFQAFTALKKHLKLESLFPQGVIQKSYLGFKSLSVFNSEFLS